MAIEKLGLLESFNILRGYFGYGLHIVATGRKSRH